MRNKDFCHLHVHSTFSKLDGFGYPKDYAIQAKEMGFEYLACTDHGNIDGLIKLQQACKEIEIKPIFGCEAYISKDHSKESPTGHISFWIKNQNGFENICKMLSEANLEGFYRRPRISFKSLLSHKNGLVIGTACMNSFVKIKGGEEFFKTLKDEVGDDLYIEIMPHNIKQQIAFNRSMVELSERTETKIIATNDCHYIKGSDCQIQEVMLAIQSKKTWNDPKRWKFNITGLHLKSANEMQAALKEIGFYKREYLTNTIEIAEKCSEFSIPKREISLPRVPGVPINPTKARKMLLTLCKDSYFEIFGHDIKTNKIYKERLESEYNLIIEKKFEKYFFIVWELCNWCRSNEILIGPGRGSVGGSLIAYLLGITSVDPIKHNLFFDRFINKDRIDYPDIDIDFEDVKRHLIKQHLETLYGENRIAGVSSFSRLQTRAAIQDVARVFEVPYAETNAFTKFIDETDSSPIPEKIDNAIKEHPECNAFAKKYPKVIKIAKRIGGQVRGTSQHAAALVISKDDIAESGRCNLVERNETRLINWEKDDAEYMGLMKLDALGLKLLSILSHCLSLIKKNQKKEINLNKIDLEDKKVLEQINNGNNVGVFQLNTWAMTSLAKEMGVESFQDVVNAIALVRPGPMNSGMTEDFIKRKKGAKYKSIHPVYDKLTAETFGLLVYQEQVMAVINKVAGLPYSTADKIRKIIGKKRDKKEFKKYEDLFKEGCRKTKIFTSDEADNFWIGLQEWVRYGFNRAHSVEYAILGIWCAYLKYYFPLEFICASLTYGDKKKKPELIEEAYKLGLSVILPKVGQSDAKEWTIKENCLYIPFIEVKGIGEVKANEAAKKIESQNEFPISSFFSKEKEKGPVKIRGSFGSLLESIGAYQKTNPEIDEKIKSLFDFRVVTNPKSQYKKLYSLLKDLKLEELDFALEGKDEILERVSEEVVRKSFKGHDSLRSCSLCELCNECKAPVSPSKGSLNIAIIGEAPGRQEDEQREGFVGKSGEKIWKFLKSKGYPRQIFHVSNIAKCYPSKSKKPNKNQISICGTNYLDKELKEINPILVLAFGNTCLDFFKDQKSGIMGMSGKTEWNEKYGCWIVWCLHPAATLYNSENEVYYKKGLTRFVDILKMLRVKRI